MRMPKSGLRRAVSALAVISAAWSTGALAAEDEQPVDETTGGEIIVTANRRAESVLDVPVAVTALNAEAIAATGATDTLSLSGKIPSLSVPQNGAVQYFLRGIGTTGSSVNAEQSVATYVDGVYVYSTWGTSVPLSSVQRVEVLKGPQGTLFGRNTTGGVIQVVTRDPLNEASTFEGSVGYGNYDTVTATAYAAYSDGQKLGVSLAADYRDQGKGYGRNLTRPTIKVPYNSRIALQGKISWQATENTKVIGFLWYDHGESSGQNNQLLPGLKGLDGVLRTYGRYDYYANTEDSLKYNSYLGYVRIEQRLNDALDLVSITSYRHVDPLYRLDQDATPATVVDATLVIPYRNFSQELQLQSAGNGPFQWTLGGFYFTNSAKYDPITIAGAAAGALGGGFYKLFRQQDTHSISGFGQASYEIMADTKITAGLRYTDETQFYRAGRNVYANPNPAFPQVTKPAEVDSSGWTWRLALDHKLTPGVMGYVSYNRGLKSGGHPLVSPTNQPAYNPERLDAYEVGLKAELFDRRVHFNVAAFLYKFKDIQVTRVTTGGNIVANAARATIKGIDADIDAKVTDNLTLFGAISILDGQYDDYKNALQFTPRATGGAVGTSIDASGRDTIYTPPFSGTAGFTYTQPTESAGTFSLSGYLQHTDRQYIGPSNLFVLPQSTVVNANLTWKSDGNHFGASLWARNLFDKAYFVQVLESSPGIFQQPAAPRTYGVTLSFKY